MHSVTVCVVLVIVGNASCSAIRTRRDLEQKIIDIYGPPKVPREMHRQLHHMPPTPDHNIMRQDVEEPKTYIPQNVLDSIFGPPVNKTKPNAEPSVPHFYSAIIASKAHITSPNAEKEVNDTFDSPPPEAMSATNNMTLLLELLGINSTTSNGTAIDFDDRFLSETLLRTQWLNNLQKTETDLTSKHPKEPEKHFQPEPVRPYREQLAGLDADPSDLETSNPRFLVPKHLEPKHLEPNSLTNASSKNFTYSSLAIVLVYFCLQSLVFV